MTIDELRLQLVMKEDERLVCRGGPDGVLIYGIAIGAHRTMVIVHQTIEDHRLRSTLTDALARLRQHAANQRLLDRNAASMLVGRWEPY